MQYLIALLLGIAFGFALNKGGLTKYGNIVGVFRLTNLTVLKFMLSAILTGGVGVYLLNALGVLVFPNIPATYIAGNVIGGLIFGVGMALSGYCPGTCAAGAGEGRLDYLFPGLIGLMAGSLLYGLTYQAVYPRIAAIANYGNVTLPMLMGVNPFLLWGILITAALFLFYVLERAGK